MHDINSMNIIYEKLNMILEMAFLLSLYNAYIVYQL